jgi:predicted nuclease of predicted toxin-antitoxin system
MRLANALVDLEHEVTSVVRDYPDVRSDVQVLQLAYVERRILITNDTDFGELVVRRALAHAGVLLIRLSTEHLPTKIQRVAEALGRSVEEPGAFVVVDDAGMRVRSTS